MISRLTEASSLWGALVIALLGFGFLPGFILNLIVRVYDRDDPRRQELLAELYVVPRRERPFWVVEQFEVATREAIFPVVSWWFSRLVWHRATLESGVERNRTNPTTFWIPDPDEKTALEPGDFVKLMWVVRGLPGERMWVEILERHGERCVGRLSNDPMFVYLEHGAKIAFHLDHVIDWHGPHDESGRADDDSPCAEDEAA